MVNYRSSSILEGGGIIMAFFMDWKFWLFCFQFISTILTLGALILIKFNDLKHLGIDVKDLKKGQECINKKLYDHAQRISKIEGKDKS